MPDEDKFKKLREVGYSIGGHCDFCKHSDFCSGQLWGKCGLHTYAHGKHTGDLRGVSIVRIGTCPQFEENATKLSWLGLGAHSEFLPGRVAQELPASKGKKQKRGS
tara:strand:- start:9971 stop:10288 length:318 start_codon:yes stop_codon:yes gene_type:complete